MIKKTKRNLFIINIIAIPIALYLFRDDSDTISIFIFNFMVTGLYHFTIFKDITEIICKFEKDEIRTIITLSNFLIATFNRAICAYEIVAFFPAIIVTKIVSAAIRDKKNRESQNLTKSLLVCPNCGSQIDSVNNFCTQCGVNLKKEEALPASPIAKLSDFNLLYYKDVNTVLENMINKELEKAGIDKNTDLIPISVIKRKNILNILFSILLFVYTSLIFFHFPIFTYVVGLIILIIFYLKNKEYNFMTYLKKEIKSRSSEKISNIIMTTKNSLSDSKKSYAKIYNIIAISLALILFISPRIMYEDIEGGYAVRFYTFGLTNFRTAEIPEEYNGKPVVSLRGNTFSNMPFLKEVTLPDSITEIRGQAFKNDLNLVKVNIPVNLEYLGGGSFYNCSSIKEIELPDSLTFLGGESFYNASSLKSIKLSNNLTEIRGNTFENCNSLESINIPDKVERIGGHAFYGNSSLKKVTLTEKSELKEIGSSAFRMCTKLTEITIPKTTNLNERAFKESPTKIKRFGDIDYDNIVDKTKYARNSFIYLQYISDTQSVNPHIKDAIIYNTSISFIDATLVQGSYQYTLKYTDETGETTFIIDKDHLYKEINENLVFSIGSEYSLDTFSSGFSLNVYYN